MHDFGSCESIELQELKSIGYIDNTSTESILDLRAALDIRLVAYNSCNDSWHTKGVRALAAMPAYHARHRAL